MSVQAVGPRRSALYVPANNQRALAKAPSLDADILIYDLEDAVLADQKALSRQSLSEHLAVSTHRAQVVIRINAINSAAFFDDLDWLQGGQNIDAVLLPKARSENEVIETKNILNRIGLDKPIWLLIETVDAILNLAELVKQVDRNAALLLGAEDLAREMRINPTPGRLGLLPILTQLILHGRSAGLTILDAIFPNLENELGFSQSCEQARNLGFDGKTLIHPKQIDVANKIFSPTEQEIERAQKIISAWSNKEAQHGVVLVDGDVVEQLHVEQARELLQRAQFNL